MSVKSGAEEVGPPGSCACLGRIRPATQRESELPRESCGCIKGGCHPQTPSMAVLEPAQDRSTEGGNPAPAEPAGSPVDFGDALPPPEHYRTLSADEYKLVLRRVGASGEAQGSGLAARLGSIVWPPAGMPRGLYRDVVREKTKYMYLYYGITALQWAGVLAHVVLGAVLGAESKPGPGGPTSSLHPLVVANTINAAVVGVLGGTGLIPRFNRSMTEFRLVENDIRRVVESRVVDDRLAGAEEVVHRLYSRFRRAYARLSMVAPPVPTGLPDQPVPGVDRPSNDGRNPVT